MLTVIILVAIVGGLLALWLHASRASGTPQQTSSTVPPEVPPVGQNETDLRVQAIPEPSLVSASPALEEPSRDYDITSVLNERTFEDQSLDIDLVGVAHYQDRLKDLASREPGGLFCAILVPEPHNASDSNAIAVHADGLGVVGYLSAADAVKYRTVAGLVSAHGLKATGLGHWFRADSREDAAIDAYVEFGPPTGLARDIRETYGPAPRVAQRPVGRAHTSGGWKLGIVAESYYQAELLRISEGRRARGTEVVFRAQLRPEPDNANDPNAVAVYVAEGTQIGYLPSDIAAEFNAFLRSQPEPVDCEAFLVGGTPDKPSIGAVLEFGSVKALKRAHRASTRASGGGRRRLDTGTQ